MHEKRYAVVGAMTLAIGEYDSRLSYNRSEIHYNPHEEEVRDMDMTESAEWERLYRENLYELLKEVIEISFDSEDYGVIADLTAAASHSQANQMVDEFESAIGYDD